MNFQGLLTGSLLLNVALIVTVGWLIQSETVPPSFPASERAERNSTPGDGGHTGAAPSLSRASGETSPAISARRSGSNSVAANVPGAPAGTSPNGGTAVNRPVATNASREEVVIQAAVSGVSSLANRSNSHLEFDPQRFRGDGNSVAIAFSGERVPVQSVVGTTAHPAATASQETKIDSVKPASGMNPSNRREIRQWPAGSFTPEEQAYRQQYGREAFAEALRQREKEQAGK